MADQQAQAVVQVEFSRGFEGMLYRSFQPCALVQAVDKRHRAAVDGEDLDGQPVAQHQRGFGVPGIPGGRVLVRRPNCHDGVGGTQRREGRMQLKA